MSTATLNPTNKNREITLIVQDATGQSSMEVTGLDPRTSVAELVPDLVSRLGLHRHGVDGPITYSAMLESELRHLHGPERIGDVVVNDDQATTATLVLQPTISAG